MKQFRVTLKKYSLWLYLLIGLELFFMLLFWAADSKAFYALVGTMLFISSLLFGAVVAIASVQEKKRQTAWEEFLVFPTEENEKELSALCGETEWELIAQMSHKIRQEEDKNKALLTRIDDYEEYVESWAHETKMPISLLTMVLDNHRGELTQDMEQKLEYVRNHMQENVNQMLFYARIKSGRKDMYFETVSVAECMEEILEDYQPLFEEKAIKVRVNLQTDTIFTDKRCFCFLLGQLISNSIKYARKETDSEIHICYEQCAGQETEGAKLTIKDNGIGVKKCDLPYIFEKGFTGDSAENRKKATGMGLYLVAELAKQMKLRLEVQSEWGKGFCMEIQFPKV